MPIEYKYVATEEPSPMHPVLPGEASPAIALSDADALKWGEYLQFYFVGFPDKESDPSTKLDPFLKEEHRHRLMYLDEHGVLKAAVPDEKPEDCMDDPAFCQNLAKLSQEGRLFIRPLGSARAHQLQTKFRKARERWETDQLQFTMTPFDTEKLEYRDIPEPKPPKAPSFWKRLFFFAFRDEIREYEEKLREFESNGGGKAEHIRFKTNMDNSYNQLNRQDGITEEQLTEELQNQDRLKRELRKLSKIDANRKDLIKQGVSREKAGEQAKGLEDCNEKHWAYFYARWQEMPPQAALRLACFTEPGANAPCDYMEAMRKRDTRGVTLADGRAPEELSQEEQQAIALRCIERNLALTNEYLPDSPEFMMLSNLSSRLWENYGKARLESLGGSEEEQKEHQRLSQMGEMVKGVSEAASIVLMSSYDRLRAMDYYMGHTVTETKETAINNTANALFGQSLIRNCASHNMLHKKGEKGFNPMLQQLADPEFVRNRKAVFRACVHTQCSQMTVPKITEMLTSNSKLRGWGVKIGKDIDQFSKQREQERLSTGEKEQEMKQQEDNTMIKKEGGLQPNGG